MLPAGPVLLERDIERLFERILSLISILFSFHLSSPRAVLAPVDNRNGSCILDSR